MDEYAHYILKESGITFKAINEFANELFRSSTVLSSVW